MPTSRLTFQNSSTSTTPVNSTVCSLQSCCRLHVAYTHTNPMSCTHSLNPAHARGAPCCEYTQPATCTPIALCTQPAHSYQANQPRMPVSCFSRVLESRRQQAHELGQRGGQAKRIAAVTTSPTLAAVSVRQASTGSVGHYIGRAAKVLLRQLRANARSNTGQWVGWPRCMRSW